jgi:hypothetical protein
VQAAVLVTAAASYRSGLTVCSQHRKRTHNVSGALPLPLLPWESNKYYIYSECVSVALVIQHAKGMRRIILPPVACLPHISHYFIMLPFVFPVLFTF